MRRAPSLSKDEAERLAPASAKPPSPSGSVGTRTLMRSSKSKESLSAISTSSGGLLPPSFSASPGRALSPAPKSAPPPSKQSSGSKSALRASGSRDSLASAAYAPGTPLTFDSGNYGDERPPSASAASPAPQLPPSASPGLPDSASSRRSLKGVVAESVAAFARRFPVLQRHSSAASEKGNSDISAQTAVQSGSASEWIDSVGEDLDALVAQSVRSAGVPFGQRLRGVSFEQSIQDDTEYGGNMHPDEPQKSDDHSAAQEPYPPKPRGLHYAGSASNISSSHSLATHGYSRAGSVVSSGAGARSRALDAALESLPDEGDLFTLISYLVNANNRASASYPGLLAPSSYVAASRESADAGIDALLFSAPDFCTPDELVDTVIKVYYSCPRDNILNHFGEDEGEVARSASLDFLERYLTQYHGLERLVVTSETGGPARLANFLRVTILGSLSRQAASAASFGDQIKSPKPRSRRHSQSREFSQLRTRTRRGSVSETGSESWNSEGAPQTSLLSTRRASDASSMMVESEHSIPVSIRRSTSTDVSPAPQPTSNLESAAAETESLAPSVSNTHGVKPAQVPAPQYGKTLKQNAENLETLPNVEKLPAGSSLLALDVMDGSTQCNSPELATDPTLNYVSQEVLNSETAFIQAQKVLLQRALEEPIAPASTPRESAPFGFRDARAPELGGGAGTATSTSNRTFYPASALGSGRSLLERATSTSMTLGVDSEDTPDRRPGAASFAVDPFEDSHARVGWAVEILRRIEAYNTSNTVKSGQRAAFGSLKYRLMSRSLREMHLLGSETLETTGAAPKARATSKSVASERKRRNSCPSRLSCPPPSLSATASVQDNSWMYTATGSASSSPPWYEDYDLFLRRFMSTGLAVELATHLPAVFPQHRMSTSALPIHHEFGEPVTPQEPFPGDEPKVDTHLNSPLSRVSSVTSIASSSQGAMARQISFGTHHHRRSSSITDAFHWARPGSARSISIGEGSGSVPRNASYSSLNASADAEALSARELLKSLDITRYPPVEVAKRLAITFYTAYLAVSRASLRTEKSRRRSRSVSRLLRLFEQTSHWPASEILYQADKRVSDRIDIFSYFVCVASASRRFGNYQAVFAIVTGLSSPSISWVAEIMHQREKALFASLKRLVKSDGNYRVYRADLTKLEAPNAPFVPFSGLMARDLTALETKVAVYREHPSEERSRRLINFARVRRIWSIVNEYLQGQSAGGIQALLRSLQSGAAQVTTSVSTSFSQHPLMNEPEDEVMTFDSLSGITSSGANLGQSFRERISNGGTTAAAAFDEAAMARAIVASSSRAASVDTQQLNEMSVTAKSVYMSRISERALHSARMLGHQLAVGSLAPRDTPEF